VHKTNKPVLMVRSEAETWAGPAATDPSQRSGWLPAGLHGRRAGLPLPVRRPFL